MDLQTRSFECRASDAGDRTIELSFASEAPVDRGSYLEVLSCREGDADLSRIGDGAHPLLLNHDTDKQIGVVEKAWIAGGKCRAKVRFGKSQLATEILQDVKDGIRKLVSVGYSIGNLLNESRDEQGNAVRRFSWAAMECSLVPIPADSTVGVGRSAERRITVMNQTVDPTNEIQTIAKILEGRGVKGVAEIANQCILRGETLEQFRAKAMACLPEAKPISTFTYEEMPARDWKRYSISRAIMNRGASGVEAEVSQEIARRSGISPSGFYVPDEFFARNLVAGTATLGGALVPVVPTGFIELLRNRAQVISAGATQLELTHPITIPRQAGAGTVNWVAETASSTLTAINFTSVTMTPQAVTAQHQYSKQLLMTGNESCDSIVRNDILQTLALEIDRVALLGSGSGEPTGIANVSGIGTVAIGPNGLALGNATAYPFLCSLESSLAGNNADGGNSLAFIMRPSHAVTLKKTQRFASTDSPIYTTVRTANGIEGEVNGYRALATNQIAHNLTTGTATTICSAIYFGSWDSLMIGNHGPLDLVVDEISGANTRTIKLFGSKWVSIGVRHPEQFCVGGGILAG